MQTGREIQSRLVRHTYRTHRRKTVGKPPPWSMHAAEGRPNRAAGVCSQECLGSFPHIMSLGAQLQTAQLPHHTFKRIAPMEALRPLQAACLRSQASKVQPRSSARASQLMNEGKLPGGGGSVIPTTASCSALLPVRRPTASNTDITPPS